MSTPPLFLNSRSLVDLPAPQPPTSLITELNDKLKRCAHLARLCPQAPGFATSNTRNLIRQYALTRKCGRQYGHAQGQRRITDAMLLGKPLHRVLRDATSQELRRVGMSRGTGVWVLRDDEGLKQQFGDTLWKKTAAGNHHTLALTRCFITGGQGNSSTIGLHHYHVSCEDILVHYFSQATLPGRLHLPQYQYWAGGVRGLQE